MYGYGAAGLGAGLIIILALFAWVAPIIVSTIIGKNKGKAGIGFVLGFFLSWIGVIIIAVMSNDRQREMEHRETLAAISGNRGGASAVKVKCPACGALADENVKFCPDCGGSM